MNDLILKKCLKCGAYVEVINDCKCNNCGIKCCNEEMIIVKPNSTEAAIEKHIPQYEIINDKIVVTVNHVMEEEHFIEWIAMVNQNSIEKIFLNKNEKAIGSFNYYPNSKIYAYCNKHGLWVNEVK